MKSTSPELLLFSPSILPEEFVVGYVFRKSYSEARNFNQAKIIFGKGRKPGWLFPSNLKAVSNASRVAAMAISTEDLLKNHTLLPALTAFLPEERKQQLIAHHLGKPAIGMWSVAGLHGASRSRRGICTSCLKEQYMDNGFGIWQRLFFMPSVFACPWHKRPLETFCAACESVSSPAWFWKPSLECLCGRSLCTIADLDDRALEVSVENASILSRVLRDGLPAEVNIATFSQVLGLRFLRGAAEVESALKDAVGESSLKLYGFQKHTYRRLTQECSLGSLAANPVQNLLVIQKILGGLDNLKLDIGRLQSLDTSSENKTIKGKRIRGRENYLNSISGWSASQLENTTENYRKRVISKLKLFPGATGSELHRMGLWDEVRHLRAVDPVWSQQHIGQSQSYKNFLDYMSPERIRGLVISIHTMYLRLISREPEKRISRSYLLEDTAFRNNMRYVNQIPEIAVILDASVDDDERYFARKAAAIALRVEKARPHTKYSNPKWYTEAAKRTTTAARFKEAYKWLNEAE